MTLRRPLLISLEVERGVRPIAGLLADPTGRRRSFQGWIELMSLLEDALGLGPVPGETVDEGRG